MGTTSSGIRYPEPGESVKVGAQNMQDLAEDVTDRYARGLRARTLLQTTTDFTTANSTACSTPITLASSRWIQLDMYISGTQVNAASTLLLNALANGASIQRLSNNALANNTAFYMFASVQHLAPVGLTTYAIQVAPSAGALRSGAPGGCILAVIDIGGAVTTPTQNADGEAGLIDEGLALPDDL